MKVYIVIENETYGSTIIRGTYFTEKRAQEKMEEFKQNTTYGQVWFDIEECKVEE